MTLSSPPVSGSSCYDWYQTGYAGALGGLGGAAAWRPTNAPLQKVLHWGGEINTGPGKWVQLPGPFAKRLTGKTIPGPPSVGYAFPGTLKYPPGFEGFLKGWMGQRILVR